MLKTTVRAGLARVPRVYCDHAHTRFFGLVLQEGAQLPERPCVQPSLPLSPAEASALAAVCKVFNNDSSPRNSRLNDTLRQYVVTIAVESQLLASQLTQMAASRLRSFRLQRTLEPEVSLINILPRSLTQEGAPRSDGGPVETQVYANDLLTSDKLTIFQADYYMQPETTLAVEKVGSSSRIAYISKRISIRRHGEADTHPTLCSGQANFRFRPIHFVGVEVIARRAQLRVWLRECSTLLLSGKRTLDSFSSLDAGLNNQVGDKGWALGIGP